MGKYGKYNEFGVSKTGEVDPRRKFVSTFIGLLGGNRKSADWLYTTIKGGNDDGKGDGKDDGKGNAGAGNTGGGRGYNYDVDFTMKGEMRRPPKWDSGYKPGGKSDRIENLIGNTRDPDRFKMGKGIIPKIPTNASENKTMKRGGLVRGAGCAQRGRGKGRVM